MPKRKDKRKSKRISIAILIDIFTTDSWESKGRGCIVDISLGGMAIESGLELPVGTELSIRINLPPGGIDSYGTIMWSQTVGTLFHYGIKYRKLSLFGKFKLRRYIKRWIKKNLPRKKPKSHL